jgi:hypothetical protein
MIKVINGQDIKFKKNIIHTLVCCNCNLVHDVYFDRDVVMTAYRNDWKTKKCLKKNSKVGKATRPV